MTDADPRTELKRIVEEALRDSLRMWQGDPRQNARNIVAALLDDPAARPLLLAALQPTPEEIGGTLDWWGLRYSFPAAPPSEEAK